MNDPTKRIKIVDGVKAIDMDTGEEIPPSELDFFLDMGTEEKLTECPEIRRRLQALWGNIKLEAREAEMREVGTATERIQREIRDLESLLGQYRDDGDWYGCIQHALDYLRESLQSQPPGTAPRVHDKDYRVAPLPESRTEYVKRKNAEFDVKYPPLRPRDE